MDTHVVAADVVAELAAAGVGGLLLAPLAVRCAASLARVNAACALLESWGYVQTQGDGAVALRPQPSVGATRVVLVVENAAAVAHVLAALLESEGYGVLIAHTLTTGLAVAAATPVSLIVADSFAPTGRDALSRLAELKRVARTAPVLLFTGHRDIGEAAVLAAGYAGLLPKPFDIDDLLARVLAAIERRAPA